MEASICSTPSAPTDFSDEDVPDCDASPGSVEATKTSGRAGRARVGKRSFRGELLDRFPSWSPGWCSPARKRLRSSLAPSATIFQDTLNGSFWKMLVGRSGGSHGGSTGTSLGEDCERLCAHGAQVTLSPPYRQSHPHSPPFSPPLSPSYRPSPGPSTLPNTPPSPQTSPRPSGHSSPRRSPSLDPPDDLDEHVQSAAEDTTESTVSSAPSEPPPVIDEPKQTSQRYCSSHSTGEDPGQFFAIHSKLSPRQFYVFTSAKESADLYPFTLNSPSQIVAVLPGEEHTGDSDPCLLREFSRDPTVECYVRVPGQYYVHIPDDGQYSVDWGSGTETPVLVPLKNLRQESGQNPEQETKGEASQDRLQDPRHAGGQSHVDSLQTSHELRERMDLLVSRPPPGDQDKVDAEEDGSVLQLLVLTPTEEGPRPPEAPVSRPKIAAALVDKCLALLMCLLALRIPCFFIVIGIAQVLLYAAPSPEVTQELKNWFVWDSMRVFHQPWRLVSYTMLHSSQLHLAMNVGVQTFIGIPLEREQGSLRPAAVYYGGAVLGATITGVVHPFLNMVGASAGIYSILMSHLAHIMLNPGKVKYGKTRAFSVVVVTCSDIAYTAHHALHRGNSAPRIGVTAHCVGALCGLFWGLALYRGAPPPHPPQQDAFPQPWPRYRLRCALQLGSRLLVASTTIISVVMLSLVRFSDKP